jgi:hypothetical protein
MYSIVESRIIGISIVIGPNLQNPISTFIGDEIRKMIGRKLADGKVFLDSQPCVQVNLSWFIKRKGSSVF